MATEKRLIDANALIKEHCEGCSADIQDMCKTDPVCASMMWIVEAPTVDAVEVVHAKWIEHPHIGFDGGYNGADYECSHCGFNDVYDTEDYNYCPNCGAKMDGGKI